MSTFPATPMLRGDEDDSTMQGRRPVRTRGQHQRGISDDSFTVDDLLVQVAEHDEPGPHHLSRMEDGTLRGKSRELRRGSLTVSSRGSRSSSHRGSSSNSSSIFMYVDEIKNRSKELRAQRRRSSQCSYSRSTDSIQSLGFDPSAKGTVTPPAEIEIKSSRMSERRLSRRMDSQRSFGSTDSVLSFDGMPLREGSSRRRSSVHSECNTAATKAQRRRSSKNNSELRGLAKKLSRELAIQPTLLQCSDASDDGESSLRRTTASSA